MAHGDYEGISVREALSKINAPNNGWYLPITQRQFVWGSRNSSEEFICLLVDSILRGFPIGGLVLWETTAPIEYRKFLSDYKVGAVERHVADSIKGVNKFLVYDGQQRLQTLYSVLLHTFNGRTLFFDLTFDFEKKEIDETGFFFRNSDEKQDRNTIISMPFLLRQKDFSTVTKYKIQDSLTQDNNLSAEERNLIRINFDQLWRVFVDNSVKSIAYFPVQADNPDAVNEVFRRLNTGGIPLTQLEMVLSGIKEKAPYFEENLWDLSRTIKDETGGYEFTAHEIVQIIYLIVFRDARVNAKKLDNEYIKSMINLFEDVKVVLPHFFKMFLFEGFHINTKGLVVRQQALLPLLVYCITLKNKNHTWEVTKINKNPLATYFIKSQLCDWNTQTMVTEFSRLSIAAAESNQPFPLEAITNIAISKNRTGEVYFYQLEAMRWFSLKILTPKRPYLFNARTPEIDHIFPLALHDELPDKEEYRQRVNVLWNLQPTSAEINNYKRAKNPVDFFKSDAGKMYFASSYDFIPQSPTDIEWQDERTFIDFRKNKMINFLKEQYDIILVSNPNSNELDNNDTF